MSLPLDDTVPVAIIGGVTLGIERSALLGFERDDGPPLVLEHTLLIVDDEIKESRLGRDILNAWLMVYDPPGNTLLFEPAL